MLESRIPSLENQYEVTVKLKRTKTTKNKDLKATTGKESTRKDSNNEKNDSPINPEAGKNLRSHHPQRKQHTKKHYYKASQSRQ